MVTAAIAENRVEGGAAVLDGAVVESVDRALLHDYAERFEAIYKEACGDHTRIPWAHACPCPWLESWLNVEAPTLVRPGGRVAVVGCGLGQDVAALVERGYEVVGMDVCPSAIEWAKRLHPECSGCFVEADLASLPGRFRGRFDLVVEVATIQSLPRALASAVVHGMVELLNHHGVIVAIARGREDGVGVGEGPPWPLSPEELISVLAGAGLEPTRAIDDFHDDHDPPVRRLRGAFRRRG